MEDLQPAAGAPLRAVMAFNPTQMAEAQSTTMQWIDKKLEGAKQDLAIADQTFDALQRARASVAPAKSLLDKAQRRVRFYEKVRAALQAGYYIIPPFDIQLFAVRTDRAPSADAGRRHWTDDQKGRSLPVGDGNWVDPRPVRVHVDTETEDDGRGGKRQVMLYENTEWRDELNIPHRALKPQIIDAIGKALEEKIFDALGIAPAYRAADPIIAGQIRRPGGGTLTFFVAWWLDEEDL